MNLYDEPFKAIKSGYKTIEMRLLTEKRKLIKVGDYIEFINNETNEFLSALVTNLYIYDSFDELYKHHDKFSLGYKENEEANPDDMLTYYKKEDILKYGVLGIEIRLS